MATQSKKNTSNRKTERAEGRSAPKATTAQRSKRSRAVAKKASSQSVGRSSNNGKSLSDLLEHALKDMYYAEKKIYRALPKMIRKADHPDLKQALEDHREETQAQIDGLEAVFDLLGKKAKGEKCEAIDGILEEGDSLLEDFGDGVASDAAIIFSCQAVEHYEITRYGSIRAFADELGLEDIRGHIDAILAQEKAADGKLSELAEASINDAASEYEDEDETEVA